VVRVSDFARLFPLQPDDPLHEPERAHRKPAGRVRAAWSKRGGPVLSAAAESKSYGAKVVRREGQAEQLRVWLQGRWLETVGFKRGAPYYVEYDFEGLTVHVIAGKNPDGKTRHVAPESPAALPIIDLTNKDMLRLFGGDGRVMVQILPGHLIVRPDEHMRLRAARTAARDGRVGSVFTGAGFLDLAAEQVGYEPAFGIEIEEKYAGIYRANRVELFDGNPSLVPIHTGGVAAVVNHNVENLLQCRQSLLPRSPELLVGGIPCQPYSLTGEGVSGPLDYYEAAIKKGTQEGEAQAALLAMTTLFLMVVQQTNPFNVVIEQVPGYQRSEAHKTLLQFLKAQGYYVAEKVLDPNGMGIPAGRERLVIVASTLSLVGFRWPEQSKDGADVWKWLTPPNRIPGDLPRSQGGWFTLGEPSAGGRGREARPGHWLLSEKGWLKVGEGGKKNYPVLLHPGSRRVGGITKSYYGPDPRGVYVWHPENVAKPGAGWRPLKGDRYRLLTVEEIKRLHGVPDDYDLELAVGPHGGTEEVSAREQVEVLGQGVVVPLFEAVIAALPGATVGRRRRHVSANPDPELAFRWAAGW